MDPYTVDFHAAFSLLLRFILLIKSPKYQSPNISRLNRPEETRKISLLKTFLRSLLSRFSPISSTWSSTRKRDVSKLRGIGHGGWDFAVNGVWNVAFTPFFGPRFHSHPRPNSRFEGPLSSRNEFLPAPWREPATKEQEEEDVTPVNIVDRESRDTSRRGIYEAASFVSAWSAWIISAPPTLLSLSLSLARLLYHQNVWRPVGDRPLITRGGLIDSIDPGQM